MSRLSQKYQSVGQSRITLLCLLAVMGMLCLVTNCWAQRGSRQPHLVFLINEDPQNYEAHHTIPPFADSLNKAGLFETTVLTGKGPNEACELSGLEVLKNADVLVVFCRRMALPYGQMQQIQEFIRAGKPVVGIRSADHGFSVRNPRKEGYEAWWGFVPDILGHEYKGHEPESLGTLVEVNSPQAAHPVLKGIDPGPWKSNGGAFQVAPLTDPDAVVLLTGSTPNIKEPAAWVRVNHYGGRVFYTSLGHPNDFSIPQFRKLLVNGLLWASGKL